MSGSEPAWAEFYSRFQRLVRMVVRRRLHFSPEETEDVVHEVFISLMSALKTYDSSNPLQNFVGTITERVCVDKYRFSKAAKRDADTEPFDDQNPRIADCIMGGPKMGHQEAELIL
ncbi:MAG: RNA polymerase sigma factor [Desulfomonilaceae bacterium]